MGPLGPPWGPMGPQAPLRLRGAACGGHSGSKINISQMLMSEKVLKLRLRGRDPSRIAAKFCDISRRNCAEIFFMATHLVKILSKGAPQGGGGREPLGPPRGAHGAPWAPWAPKPPSPGAAFLAGAFFHQKAWFRVFLIEQLTRKAFRTPPSPPSPGRRSLQGNFFIRK